MRLIIIIISVLFYGLCNRPKNKGTVSGQSGSNIKQPIDTVYERDKNHFANAYIDNVEAFRTSEKDNKQDTQSALVYSDPANIYMPYAIRYNTQSKNYEWSPLPTSEQISVDTDTIVYSRDSLLCVAFVTIDNHFSDIPPYEPKTKKWIYDGRALIGYRKNIRNQFNIYPFEIYTVISLDDRNDVVYLLRKYYFREIVGKIGPAGSNIEDIVYPCGIGDPEFFDKAPNFIKNDGKYKFEFYRKGNKELPYIYPGNISMTDSE